MNVLDLNVPNPSEVLHSPAYGGSAVIRVERYSGSSWSEIGTVALGTATTVYTYYDSTGSSTSRYRTRYSDGDASPTYYSEYGADFRPAAVTTTYVSLDALKSRLGIAATDTTDDELLWTLIEQASEEVTQRTGRYFTRDDVDTVITQDGFDALEAGRLFLFPRGIVSLTKVEVAAYTGDTYVEVVSGDWFLRPTGPDQQPGWPYTELWITNVPHPQSTLPMIPSGFDTLRLTGQFGWPSVPSDIARVTLNYAVKLWRQRGAGGDDTVTIGTDGQRVVNRDFNDTDYRTLQRYTRRDVDIV